MILSFIFHIQIKYSYRSTFYNPTVLMHEIYHANPQEHAPDIFLINHFNLKE